MDEDSVFDNDATSEEWDSGPFCQHWGDPSDCEILCACGHKCCEHGTGPCKSESCHCNGFVDISQKGLNAKTDH